MAEKYSEFIKGIARVIAEQDTENFLLKMELENVKAQLAHCEKQRAAAEAQLEDIVARNACNCEEGNVNA